jgi:ABC-type Na+ efflux pump permease subunit
MNFATVSPYVVLLASLYLLGMSFLLNTHNAISTFWFKLVPFLLGLAMIIVALKGLGVLA